MLTEQTFRSFASFITSQQTSQSAVALARNDASSSGFLSDISLGDDVANYVAMAAVGLTALGLTAAAYRYFMNRPAVQENTVPTIEQRPTIEDVTDMRQQCGTESPAEQTLVVQAEIAPVEQPSSTLVIEELDRPVESDVRSEQGQEAFVAEEAAPARAEQPVTITQPGRRQAAPGYSKATHASKGRGVTQKQRDQIAEKRAEASSKRADTTAAQTVNRSRSNAAPSRVVAESRYKQAAAARAKPQPLVDGLTRREVRRNKVVDGKARNDANKAAKRNALNTRYASDLNSSRNEQAQKTEQLKNKVEVRKGEARDRLAARKSERAALEIKAGIATVRA